jgi:hypothetical protein
MSISFKGAHFPPEVILMGVRWYVGIVKLLTILPSP